MTQYALGTFVILAISGILSLLSYGFGTSEKIAVGIITAFIIISPILSAVRQVDASGLLDSITDSGYEPDKTPSLVAEKAFAEGIKSAISEKYTIDKDNIRVKITAFDMKAMMAGEIKIFLCGRAALADYRGIEEYVNGLGMGVCRVEIELGQRDN